MKKILTSLFLTGVFTSAFAQGGGAEMVVSSLHVGLKAGGGLALKYNYDVSAAADLEIYYPVKQFMFGVNFEYQMMGLRYQKTSPDAPFHDGYSGYSLINQSSYGFATPEILLSFGPANEPRMFDVYIDGGVGNLISGKETIRKWDNTYNYPLNAVNNYDSTINTSKNINSMLFRYGFGLTEHVSCSHQMTFTFTEDFSFIPGSISTTTNPGDPHRNAYAPNTIAPNYFTFKVGVNFFRKSHKYN